MWYQYYISTTWKCGPLLRVSRQTVSNANTYCNSSEAILHFVLQIRTFLNLFCGFYSHKHHWSWILVVIVEWISTNLDRQIDVILHRFLWVCYGLRDIYKLFYSNYFCCPRRCAYTILEVFTTFLSTVLHGNFYSFYGFCHENRCFLSYLPCQWE